MNNISEAVDHYLPKKKRGEMSISDIRKELAEQSNFSEEDIIEICKIISDEELMAIENKKQPFRLAFLDKPWFSVFMILASIAIFVYSFILFKEIQDLAAEGYEINDIDYFLPGFFMLASIIYLVRHVFRLIKRIKGR